MSRIFNLTPHTINVIAEDGSVIASFPSEGVARATQTAEHVGELNGVELVSMKFGNPIDLPAPGDIVTCGRGCDSCPRGCKTVTWENCYECEHSVTEETFYIVSVITANAAKACGRGADDLLITADPVRDEAGRIIGCRRFALV